MNEQMDRWYLRCTRCLEVTAVDLPRPKTPGVSWMCDVCDFRLETIGRVKGARLVQDALECPCDLRCTNAGGPHCDCSCGGTNHGTGKMVEVLYDAGSVPRVRPRDPERARRIVAEVTAAEERIRSLLDVNNDWQTHHLRGEFRRYCHFKIHSTRMKALAELEERLKARRDTP